MIFIRIGQFFRPGPDRLRENRSTSSDALAGASFPPVSAPAVPVPEVRFPCHPPLPRQPTECRTSARRIFLSAGFCTSPLSMRRLLHAVCTRLYLRTDTRASRLIFPVPPVFAIEHNRGPPWRKFPLTQTRHTRLRPYFDKPDENGPPGRGSFPSPPGRYPPTAKTSLPFILPKRSANRHVFSPTVTGTQGGREPQPSVIVNFPAPSVPDTAPAHRGNVPAALGVRLCCIHRTAKRERFAPPSSSRPVFGYRAKKSNPRSTKNLFDRKSSRPGIPTLFRHRSNPRPDLPTVRMWNEDRDGQNGPLPASSSHDGRTKPGDRRRHELFVRPLKQTVTRRYTKFSTLRPLPATEVCRAHFPCRPPSGRQGASPILRKTQNSSFRLKHFSAGKKTIRQKQKTGHTKSRQRKTENGTALETSAAKPPPLRTLNPLLRPLPRSGNATPSERCLFMRYNRCPTSEAIRIKRYPVRFHTLLHHSVLLKALRKRKEGVLPDTLPCILSSLILRARGIPAIRRVWQIRHP